MADLPKRALGRTGLQVTMLGYGAMELRGVPRGREVTEVQNNINALLHGPLPPDLYAEAKRRLAAAGSAP